MEDLYNEHEAQHTSEDWANLKDRCSECHKASKSVTNFIAGDWREMLGTSIHAWKNEDRILSPNALEF